MRAGSGENGELTILDTISILSFLIGLENLDMNVTQTDAQNLQHQLDNNTHLILGEIHKHLEEQDIKMSETLSKLEEIQNDLNRNLRQNFKSHTHRYDDSRTNGQLL